MARGWVSWGCGEVTEKGGRCHKGAKILIDTCRALGRSQWAFGLLEYLFAQA